MTREGRSRRGKKQSRAQGAPGSNPCCCYCKEDQRTSGQGPKSQALGASKGDRNQNGSEDQTDSGGCGIPGLLARRIGRGLRACAFFAPKEELPLPKEAPKIPASVLKERRHRSAKHSGKQGARRGAGFRFLPVVPAPVASAVSMDVEEGEALDLGVPARSNSLPSIWERRNMDVEQRRKRTRGCIRSFGSSKRWLPLRAKRR
eukprot:1379296-Amphidinium_carterae.1